MLKCQKFKGLNYANEHGLFVESACKKKNPFIILLWGSM